MPGAAMVSNDEPQEEAVSAETADTLTDLMVYTVTNGTASNFVMVDARTYTSKDGYATAVFWVQDGEGRPYDEARLPRLREVSISTSPGVTLQFPDGRTFGPAPMG